jgi:hypothetical protein
MYFTRIKIYPNKTGFVKSAPGGLVQEVRVEAHHVSAKSRAGVRIRLGKY